MQSRAFGEDFSGRLGGAVQEQLAAPREVIFFAGVEVGGLLRIREPLRQDRRIVRRDRQTIDAR